MSRPVSSYPDCFSLTAGKCHGNTLKETTTASSSICQNLSSSFPVFRQWATTSVNAPSLNNVRCNRQFFSGTRTVNIRQGAHHATFSVLLFLHPLSSFQTFASVPLSQISAHVHSQCLRTPVLAQLGRRLLTISRETRRTDSGTQLDRRLEFQDGNIIVEGEDAEVGINFGFYQFPLDGFCLRLTHHVVLPQNRADVSHVESETNLI